MLRKSMFALVAAGAVVLAASSKPPSPSETKWSLTAEKKIVGSITLISDGVKARAEWKSDPQKAAIIFISTAGKIWVKNQGGDLELENYRGGVEKQLAPLLLPPIVNATKLRSKNNGPATHDSGSLKATYRYDADGATSVEILSSGKSWLLSRVSSRNLPSAAPSLFAVSTQKQSTTRIARMAGDLFAPADRSVSATAGAKGVEAGASFADGGDYAALRKLEERDHQWKSKLEAALEEFQKEGSVGSSKGGSR